MFPPETRFLVCDDSMSMQEVVARSLADLGYTQVLKARTGRAGFEILENGLKENKPIGVFFCDMNMPGMDGLSLLRKIRSMPEFNSLTFLMISAEAQSEYISTSLEAGANGYLLKPFNKTLLKKELTTVWEQQKKATK